MEIINKSIKNKHFDKSEFNDFVEHIISYKKLSRSTYTVVKVQNVCVCLWEREIFGGVRMNVAIISPRLLKFGDMVSLVGQASAESLAEIRTDWNSSLASVP